MIRQWLPNLNVTRCTRGITNGRALFATSRRLRGRDVAKEADSLLMKLNSSEDIITQYEEFGKKLTSKELRVLSGQILRTYDPRGTANDEILGLALRPFKDDKISEDLINETLNIVLKFSKTGSFPESSQRELTRRLVRINDQNPQFLMQFEKTILGHENRHNRNMLISLYLQTKQLQKAYDLVVSNIRNPQALRVSGIELVILHLCHREDLERASTLIKLSARHGYVLYSRTLATFLTRAIELGDANICYQYFPEIVRKIYIDNGSLMSLIELVSNVGYVRDVKRLYKLLHDKTDSFPREFARRYNRSMVECMARVRGFKRAFHLLEEHPPRSLKVGDYPHLLENITVSSKLRKIEFTLLKRVNYPKSSIPMKQFYLNLIVAKLAGLGEIEKALEVLKVHSKVRRYMTPDTVSYITRGLGASPSITGLESLFVVLEQSPLKLSRKRVIDPLLELIIHSDYWFKVFQVLDKTVSANYKLPPTLAYTLKQKCEEFGYTQHEKYM